MIEQKGLLVGITGGIACGKSEVGRILASMGVPVCDTDQLAHEAMAPDGPAYAAVLHHFGSAMLRGDGTIDRGRLADVVFDNARERAALNALVHPHVRAAWRAWVKAECAAHDAVAVIVPLLFEVGADTEMNATICVTATEYRIRERLAARGWTAAQAAARQAAQMALAEKIRRSDYIINNNGTRTELEAETRRVWQGLLRKER